MVDIKAYGKNELTALKIQFISIPVLSIPYLDKIFYMKPLWFSSPEDAKNNLKKIDPLIIFNQTGEYSKDSVRGFQDKLPQNWSSPTAIFVRAIQGLDVNTWNKILTNVLEPDNMNFTFKWDFDNYDHPLIVSHRKKQEALKLSQMSYDERERQEHIKAHTHTKISFKR